jgi:hypothetical protein
MAWGITAQKVIDQSGASAAFSSSSGTVTGATTGQYAVLFLTGRKNNNTDVPNASLTVTLGGSAMSFQEQSNATSVAEWAAIYVLPVPSSGDLTLSVSGVSFRALEAHVFLLTGHNTGAPVVVSGGVRTTSNITTQSFTRTTAANGNLLLSSICIRSVGDVTSTLSLVNGGTLEINDATGNNTTYDITSASASEIVATAAADGHGYSWTGSTRSCLVWIEMAVDAGTSALTFPGAGSVTAQGLAPTVAAGVGIAAGVGSVAVQGLQPVIGISVARTTGKGAVSAQGLAPAVLSIPASEATWVGVDAYWVGEPVRWSLDAAVAAGKGAVTVQGHAPVVAAGSVRLTGLGAVSAQGLAPTVSVSSNVAAGAGAVAVAGSPPTVLTASGVIVGRNRRAGRAGACPRGGIGCVGAVPDGSGGGAGPRPGGDSGCRGIGRGRGRHGAGAGP